MRCNTHMQFFDWTFYERIPFYCWSNSNTISNTIKKKNKHKSMWTLWWNDLVSDQQNPPHVNWLLYFPLNSVTFSRFPDDGQSHTDREPFSLAVCPRFRISNVLNATETTILLYFGIWINIYSRFIFFRLQRFVCFEISSCNSHVFIWTEMIFTLIMLSFVAAMPRAYTHRLWHTFDWSDFCCWNVNIPFGVCLLVNSTHPH